MRFILAVFALAALSACSSAEVKKADRWSAYPGCNAAQCRSWQQECSAECINQQEASVTECENKCSARVPDCEAACPG